MDRPLGLEKQVQIAHIATRFYREGRTRVEIADETGLSRFKVSRLLEEAVESGIVQFVITSPSGDDVDLPLSAQVRDRFGLAYCVVVDVPGQSDEDIQRRLGETTADLLRDILAEDDVLGLTSGRTLNAMSRAITALPVHQVVQLSGVAGPLQQTGLEVMRRISALGGIRPWPIYSSLVMSDALAAEGVRRQPELRQTFDQFHRVTVAVGAIGSWAPRNSLMLDNPAFTDDDRKRLLARGVVAEFAAILVRDDGSTVSDIADRCIAITEEQLREVPAVIAAAGGPAKTRAIRAVLSSGLLSGLVTDSATAKRLLDGARQ
jgi:DNA-binding transcriptional regulator LsrR (DeoR family)